MNKIKKIAIMTGGGDCPGLNAVIRAAVMTATSKYGLEVVGIKNAYRGLYLGKSQIIPLLPDNVADIIGDGGTILYNSNKDNLFKYPRRNKNGLIRDENGDVVYDDLSDIAVKNLKENGIDALIVVGGDGTLTSARDYFFKGVNVIGVPKTIDNDLNSTDVTFGFDTALNRSVDSLECIKTTGEAHHRVMVFEVMGRDAGHLALSTGIAAGADITLIPEIKYDINKVIDAAKKALLSEKQYALIVVAEGVKSPDGSNIGMTNEYAPDGVKYKGIGEKIASIIENELNSDRDEKGYAISETIMDVEARATVIGHVCRGGPPSAIDRILSTRYGSFAVDMLMEGKFGEMVALRGGNLTTIPLTEVIPSNDMTSNFKPVDVNGELVKLAKTVGICLGA